MKKTVIVIVALAIVIVFIKFFLVVAGIVALGASGYFIYQAVRNKAERHALLKKRVLPAVLVMILCFGFTGALAGNQQTGHHEESSSAKTSHKHSTRSSSSDDADDESKDEDADAESSAERSDTTESAAKDEDTSNASSTAPSATAESTNTTVRNNGDMTTDQAGTIVGNSRTMVYHTPGQHGYRMNSGNAVYFKSEAEAQAAGYQKALR